MRQRRLQFRQLGLGFRLLRLGHFDIVARRVIGRLRRLHRRHALVAAGFGLFEGRARGETLVAERLLAIVIETGALQRRFLGSELGAGLLDRAHQSGDLAADPVDGGLLGRDPGARGIHRDLVVAVVNFEDDIAGMNDRIVGRQDRRDMARHPRAERGVVGADIGVVGRDIEAADQKIIGAIADGRERQQSEHAHHDEFALARLGGGRLVGRFGRRRSRSLGRRTGRRIRGAAPGFFRDVGPQLIRQLGGARNFVLRRFRLGTNDACCLVSRCGHTRPPHSNFAMQVRPKTGRTGTITCKSTIDRTVRSRYILTRQTIERKTLPRPYPGLKSFARR